jgi:hypothetical protein
MCVLFDTALALAMVLSPSAIFGSLRGCLGLELPAPVEQAAPAHHVGFVVPCGGHLMFSTYVEPAVPGGPSFLCWSAPDEADGDDAASSGYEPPRTRY